MKLASSIPTCSVASVPLLTGAHFRIKKLDPFRKEKIEEFPRNPKNSKSFSEEDRRKGPSPSPP
jgi:hypothetical protein